MSSYGAVVLYEDQRAPNGGFGLHAFALAAVGDRIQRTRHDLRAQVQPMPMNGAGNVIRALDRAQALELARPCLLRRRG